MTFETRRLLSATCLLVSAVIASVGCRSEGRAPTMRTAIIPPVNQPTIAERVREISAEYDLHVDRLTPEALVASELTADRYPAAFYVGAESYLLKVKRPGDATERLLAYLKDGGLLVVCGGVWPFFKPVDYTGAGRYAPSEHRPGTLPSIDDAWIKRQLDRLRPEKTPKFNTAVGLNISGPGTTWFEEPPEPVAFEVEPDQDILPCLPKEIPFPDSGEQRYRPVSGGGLPAGTGFTPVLRLKGKSGKDYGPGAALVDLDGGGRVLYIWSPLLRGELGNAIIRDALVLAAENTDTKPDETEILQQRVDVLNDSVNSVQQKIEKLVAPRMSPHYFRRQAEATRRLIEKADYGIKLGNIEYAREKLAEVGHNLNLLNHRIKAVSKGL